MFNFGVATAELPDRPWLPLRVFHIVKQASGPNDVVDTGENLRRAFADEGTLVLIRPDGYIGAIANTRPELVASYLKRLSPGSIQR